MQQAPANKVPIVIIIITEREVRLHSKTKMSCIFTHLKVQSWTLHPVQPHIWTVFTNRIEIKLEYLSKIQSLAKFERKGFRHYCILSNAVQPWPPEPTFFILVRCLLNVEVRTLNPDLVIITPRRTHILVFEKWTFFNIRQELFGYGISSGLHCILKFKL